MTSRCRPPSSTSWLSWPSSAAPTGPGSPAPGSAAASSRSRSATMPTTSPRRWRSAIEPPLGTSPWCSPCGQSTARAFPVDAPRRGKALHAREQLGLLALELFLGDVTLVAQPRELGDLLGNPGARARGRGAHASRHGVGHRRCTNARIASRVQLHLAVDLLLHAVGVTDVLEGADAVLARRL